MSEDAYKRAYKREKLARLEAEQLLEDKSRELYLSNQQLSQKHNALMTQQSAMIKNEKLASIGLLSAGIAHEINNPLAFVSSNLEVLDSYWQSMNALYERVQELLLNQHIPEDIKSALSKLVIEKDLEYIASDFINLFDDTNDGLKRVTTIVQNLQHFSRTQEEDWDYCDMNKSIQSTLKIINHQIKQCNCQVNLSLQTLEKSWCNIGELNQVFLNLLQNAIHAMENSPTKILNIITWQDSKSVYLSIEDSGHGIKTEHFEKIFTPFFTTKAIGEGTGLGLHISYKIILDHKGTIDISSEAGFGAKFTIQLPIKQQQGE
jgi:C4-dicarboxylate-specific signal transduction histidine kinase